MVKAALRQCGEAAYAGRVVFPMGRPALFYFGRSALRVEIGTFDSGSSHSHPRAAANSATKPWSPVYLRMTLNSAVAALAAFPALSMA